MATAIGAYATTAAMKTLAGITASDDDTLIGLICDRVNQYIESTCKQVLSPITSAVYLYDGNGLTRMYLPVPVSATTLGIGGIRAVSLVEIASETAGTFETIAAGDYFLRGHKGISGPYRWLALSNLPAGSYTTFPEGRANVRVTATAGWTAIPDDVTEMALNASIRAWNARQSGQQTVVGTDGTGQWSVAQYMDPRDKATLKAYTLKMPT